MESLFGDISALLQHSPWLAVFAVFLGGVTTALNPCVLAMVPLLMSVVAGNKETTTVRRSLVFSLLFVLGLAVFCRRYIRGVTDYVAAGRVAGR